MTTFSVYVLTDEDQTKFHFVGITSQPPKKRVSDLMASVRLGKQGRSMLNAWIKDLLAAKKTVDFIVLDTFDDLETARIKMTDLVAEFTNTQHPIKNSYRADRLCNHQGRPLKEKANAVNE